MEPIRYAAIQTDEEYRAKLAQCQALAEKDPEPHSEDGARLIALATVIEAWEHDHYPIREARND